MLNKYGCDRTRRCYRISLFKIPSLPAQIHNILVIITSICLWGEFESRCDSNSIIIILREKNCTSNLVQIFSSKNVHADKHICSRTFLITLTTCAEQVFCIFLFLASSTIFGTILSQVNLLRSSSFKINTLNFKSTSPCLLL